jgi:hypothetical protein
MTTPSNDDVIDATRDTGVPHDRTASGGMPRVDDDLLAELADKDRAAAGLVDDGPADGDVPPAT